VAQTHFCHLLSSRINEHQQNLNNVAQGILPHSYVILSACHHNPDACQARLWLRHPPQEVSPGMKGNIQQPRGGCESQPMGLAARPTVY
jgi:hypothetical protein